MSGCVFVVCLLAFEAIPDDNSQHAVITALITHTLHHQSLMSYCESPISQLATHSLPDASHSIRPAAPITALITTPVLTIATSCSSDHAGST